MFTWLHTSGNWFGFSGGSRPSDKGGGGGGGGGCHPDPKIRGEAVSKNNFFGPSGLSLV